MATTTLLPIAELQGQAKSKIYTLTVAEMKEVCKVFSLGVSGRKHELQIRLENKLSHYAAISDGDAIQRLLWLLNNPNGPSRGQTMANGWPGSTSTSTSYNHQSYQPSTMPRYQTFKKSPFYTPEKLLGQFSLPACPSHRSNGSATFSFTMEDIHHLNSTKNRVLIFAAQKADILTPAEIAFPSQIEIRVNDHDVKANTKGIKGKPGTTRPVDITALLRKREHVVNKVSITYAQTDKIFLILIHMAVKKTNDELIAEVRTRRIKKDRILKEILARAQDTDIVQGVTVIKLKDPVSFARISIPCRGTACVHPACFDAATYLAMQEQAPIWECPICSKKVPLEQLAVDEYVQEILQNTSPSVEQVTILPDGSWSRDAHKPNGTNRTGHGAYDDDDDDDSNDDLIEISAPRPATHIKSERNNTPQSLGRTPPMNSESRGQKRPAPDVIVIDSDSEDESARPAPKRHQGSTSYHTQVPPHTIASSPHSYSPVSFHLPTPTGLRDGTGSPFQNTNNMNPMIPNYTSISGSYVPYSAYQPQFTQNNTNLHPNTGMQGYLGHLQNFSRGSMSASISPRALPTTQDQPQSPTQSTVSNPNHSQHYNLMDKFFNAMPG